MKNTVTVRCDAARKLESVELTLLVDKIVAVEIGQKDGHFGTVVRIFTDIRCHCLRFMGEDGARQCRDTIVKAMRGEPSPEPAKLKRHEGMWSDDETGESTADGLWLWLVGRGWTPPGV